MSDEQLKMAWARACRLYSHQAFRSAYYRGAEAASAGRPPESCPYDPRRGGWASSYHATWMHGYRSVEE